MALIFKLLAVLTTLASTIFLIVEGVQSGLLIVSTIFGIVKIIVIIAFCALLIYIFYLLLSNSRIDVETRKER